MLPFDVVGVAEVVALVLLVHVEEDDHSGYEVNHLAGGKKMKIGSAVASPVPVTDTILQELDHCNYLSALKILILIHSLITKLNKKKDTPIRSSVWTPAPCSSWRRCTSPWRRWGRRRWPVGRGGRTWPFRPLRSRRHPAPWNHAHTHTHTWTKYSTISSQWRPPGGAESASPIRRPGPQKKQTKSQKSSYQFELNLIRDWLIEDEFRVAAARRRCERPPLPVYPDSSLSITIHGWKIHQSITQSIWHGRRRSELKFEWRWAGGAASGASQISIRPASKYPNQVWDEKGSIKSPSIRSQFQWREATNSACKLDANAPQNKWIINQINWLRLTYRLLRT